MAILDKFDKLGEKITNKGSQIKQQTKNITDTVRFNGLISDEEKRVEAYYTQTGKIYYENFARGPDPLFVDLVAKINESKSRIADYSQQIKLIKGVNNCTNCGAEVSNNTPFCGNCGASMIVTTAPISNDDEKRCENCGAALNEDLAFCTNCGQKIARGEE